MAQSFKIITLGCKVNQYESAYLDEALTDAGLKRAEEGDRAHISVINTCIVTQTASHQSRQEIRKAVRENPDGVVVATGCYAQAFPDELSQIEGISLIAGNTEKRKLPERILNITKPGKVKTLSGDFEPGTPKLTTAYPRYVEVRDRLRIEPAAVVRSLIPQALKAFHQRITQGM